MPDLAWKTPIFHPNISGSGIVCLGGYGTHWVPSLNLDELCTMLWDMIRYQNYDVESPYNREAANWARIQTDISLPIDTRPIRDRVATPGRSAKEKHIPPISGGGQPDVLFIEGERVVSAEVVEPEDPDILFIE